MSYVDHGHRHGTGGSDRQGGGFVAMDVDGNEASSLTVVATNADGEGNGIYIESQDGQGISLKASDGGEVSLSSNDATGTVRLSADAQITIDLNSVGAKLRVNNHSGSSIFEVREDGTVHIKTGTSIVADL